MIRFRSILFPRIEISSPRLQNGELRGAIDGSRNKWAAQPILLIITADVAGDAGIAGKDSGARPNDEDRINPRIIQNPNSLCIFIKFDVGAPAR
jgi:hypothetical protein